MTDIVDLKFEADATQIDKATESLKKNAEAAKTVANQNSVLAGETKKTGAGFTELAQTASKLTGGALDVEGAMSKLATGGLGIATLGAGLLVTAAAAAYHAMSELREKSIEAGDAMNDLANRTNVATERLSLIDAMAKMAGSSVNELVDSSERLAMKLARQDETTGRAVVALKTLGVETKNANGETKSMLQLQEDIVIAVENATDKSKAEGAAVQLLGTEYYKLRNVIKEAKESKSEMYDYMLKTNALISGSLAKNSDAYKDTVSKMGLAFTGIGNSIAEATLPNMIKFQSKMVEIAEYAADVIRRFAGLTTASEETGTALGKLIVDRDNLNKSIAKMENSPLYTEGGDSSVLINARKRVEAINDQIREMSRLKQGADSAAESIKKATTDGRAGEGARVTGKDTTSTVTSVADSGYAQANKKEEDTVIKLRAAYTALFGIQTNVHELELQASIDAGDFNAKWNKKGELIKAAATAEEIASLRSKAANADYLEGLNRATKAENDRWTAAERVIESEQKKVTAMRQTVAEQNIQRDVLKVYGKTQDDVNIAISQYNIAQAETALAIAKASGATEQEVEQLNAKISALKEIQGLQSDQKDSNDAELKSQRTFSVGWEKAFKDYEKNAGDSAKTAGDIFNGVTDKMGNALATFVTTGKLDFKSLAASIIADLAKIAAEKAIAGIVANLFADGGAFSGGTQFFADGGVVSSPTGFAMAGGKMGVMGEAGPEAVMPLSRGSDGKLGVKASGGSSSSTTQINNNLTVSIGSVDSNERKVELLQEIQKVMVSTAKQTMANEMRQGGMLNRKAA